MAYFVLARQNNYRLSIDSSKMPYRIDLVRLFLKIFGGILPVIVISTPSYLSFWTKWRIFFTLGWSWLVQSYRLNQKFLYSQTVRKWHPHWIKGNIWFRLQAWTSAKFNIEWGGGKIYYPSGIAVDSERILLKRLAIHPSRSIGRVMGNR